MVTLSLQSAALSAVKEAQDSQRRGPEKAIRAFVWIQIVNILVLQCSEQFISKL